MTLKTSENGFYFQIGWCALASGEQHEASGDGNHKNTPCIGEQIQASGFPGLSRVPVSTGFLVQLWNYGSAAQFSGKRERSCWFINPLVLKF